MKLRAADYFLARFAQRSAPLLKALGDLETDWLGAQLKDVPLERPVFIAGLARSGSTMLLELFARLREVGTHRYRDFPLLFAPWLWNRFQQRFAGAEAPVERPHCDRIAITKESPEAFEEPLWMHFFPFVHDAQASHVLTRDVANPEFERFFGEHLRKILLVRGRSRYVSKGNYNITRLQYLGRLFPDARFVIPVRHPCSHVNSLLRQHRLFSHYGAGDRRVPHYLRAAGHFEFGSQRVPINLDAPSTRRVLDAWEAGDEALGYAILWRRVYAHAHALGDRDPQLARRITFVRYEDFCARPAALLRELFELCGLGEGVDELLDNLPAIAPPDPSRERAPQAQHDRIWQETGELAQALGYRRDGLAEAHAA